MPWQPPRAHPCFLPHTLPFGREINHVHDNPLPVGILIVTKGGTDKLQQRSTTMKLRTSLRKPHAAAFTLIELLTVIAIIAILMGLLFPVLSSAKNQARRQAAAVAIRNIVSASKSYQTDYGKFPPVPAARVGDEKTSGYYSYGDKDNGGCQATNEQLFDILRSINRGANANFALNKRQQKYFEMGKAKDAKAPRDGFVDGSEFTGGTQGTLMDPWGTQYCVILDAADAGTIDMSTFFTDLNGAPNLLRQSAVAFSMGIDGKRGGKGYKDQLRKSGSTEAPDDVVSWQ